VQTFTYIQDLIYKDKVQPQPAESQSMRSGGVTNLFAAGQVAMTISDLSLGKLLQQGVNFTWGVGVYPKGPQSDRVAPLYPDGWSAFKATKHPDVAWSLLKYVSSKDQNLAYMNALGWAPMRKDIVDEYAKATGAAAGFSADDFSKVYMGQMDHVQISETHAILQWSQLWSTTISPTQDALLLNHSSPKRLYD
jgi:multiple sugar transport system substrate-binding protein